MILRDDPIDVYHARLRGDPPTYSHTSLRWGAVHGWRSFRMLHLGEIEMPDTPAFAEGREVEAFICEGKEAFDALCAVKPDGYDGRTKEGKAWAAEVGNRRIVTADYARMVQDMDCAVREDDTCRAIVDTFEKQLTLDAEVNGIRVQVKPDLCRIDGDQAISVNLKTCADLNKLVSGRQIADFGYHTSFGLERIVFRANGITLTECYDLCVEKSYPSRCALIPLAPMFIDIGELEVTRWLERVAECTATNRWPRTDSVLVAPVEPPPWLMRGA